MKKQWLLLCFVLLLVLAGCGGAQPPPDAVRWGKIKIRLVHRFFIILTALSAVTEKYGLRRRRAVII